MIAAPLGWGAIVRLGLVQTSLGAVVVLMTSTINRVMVVELALPAFVPGLLIASHYAVQILRPAWGYGSDVGGSRTPWILGGMASLALGGFGAALATALTASAPAAGLALAALSFLLVGVGAGAAGTSVLATLAARVAPERRAAAATIVWVMMIAGFALTAPIAGSLLDPFSNARLVAVAGGVCAIAFCIAALATFGLETSGGAPKREETGFKAALGQAFSEPATRRLTVFIFVSMLAYSAQELLVEPFGGLVFGLPPGVTTKLAGVQHGGVLLGMLTVAGLATGIGGPLLGSLRLWTIVGCSASALALLGVAAAGLYADVNALRAGVFMLGLCNGAFAVAAIGLMMSLAGAGAQAREGTRMGLWGAAQAIAFALGGVVATGLVDVARWSGSPPLQAYAGVFVAEALLFVVSARLAAGLGEAVSAHRRASGDARALGASVG